MPLHLGAILWETGKGARKMASERQIKANRNNARQSTGPRTAGGKARSSRNAFRHGLSRPLAGDDPRLKRIAEVIADEVGDSSIAQEIARNAMELSRIRHVRDHLIAEMAAGGGCPDLKRLLALQRYNRLSLAKRRRVMKEG